MRFTKTLVALIAMNSLASCTNTQPEDTECQSETIPSAESTAALLKFQMNSDIKPCSVVAYVVGHQAESKLDYTSEGFYLSSIPAGSQDVIIRSVDENKAARLPALAFELGQTLELGEISLEDTGYIVGKATLADSNDATGILVSLPGTDYASAPAMDGTYLIAGVPTGLHTLSFNKAGYNVAEKTQITVTSGVQTSIDSVILIATESPNEEDSGSATSLVRTLSSDGLDIGKQVLGEEKTLVQIGRRIYTYGILNISCTAISNGVQTEQGCAAGGAYYDLDLDNGWKPIANAPKSTRGYFSIVYAGAKLINFGGWEGWTGVASGTRSDLGLQIYDPSTDSWSQSMASNSPAVRSASVVASTGSTVLVWAGFSYLPYPNGFFARNDFYEYDVATDSWTSLPAGPLSTRPTSGSHRDKGVWTGTELYIFAADRYCYTYGSQCPENLSGTIAIYNKASKQWRTLPQLLNVSYQPVYFNGFIYFTQERKKLDTATGEISDWAPVTIIGQYGFIEVDGQLYNHDRLQMMPFERP